MEEEEDGVSAGTMSLVAGSVDTDLGCTVPCCTLACSGRITYHVGDMSRAWLTRATNDATRHETNKDTKRCVVKHVRAANKQNTDAKNKTNHGVKTSPVPPNVPAGRL